MKKMKLSELIAAKVKEKRIERGISQVNLAQSIGMTARTIINIERGVPCSVTTLQALCDVLNIKIIIE